MYFVTVFVRKKETHLKGFRLGSHLPQGVQRSKFSIELRHFYTNWNRCNHRYTDTIQKEK